MNEEHSLSVTFYTDYILYQFIMGLAHLACQ